MSYHVSSLSGLFILIVYSWAAPVNRRFPGTDSETVAPIPIALCALDRNLWCRHSMQAMNQAPGTTDRQSSERSLAPDSAAWFAMAVLASWSPAALAGVNDCLKMPDAWFKSPEGSQAVSNVLSWQSSNGSWPKNMDTSQKTSSKDPAKVTGTYDNGATTGELRLLARAFNATGNPQCKAAFLKGLTHLLESQYPNGGWPQSYPPGTGYARHITFNDNAMIRLLELLREISDSTNYGFIDAALREEARTRFDRGIQCILKCQVRVKGERTVWCAQHDETDLQPRGARTYELPSLSGSESASILKLLMSLDNPTPEVREAIRSGARWFRSNQVHGIRLERRDGERIAVADPNSPALWARFYEIETGRPIYSSRDGIRKYDYNQISAERRNGYSWLGTWGDDVEKNYTRWVKERDQSN